MREITLKLYQFDELSDEAKQKALVEYPPEWHEGDTDYIVDEAKEYVADMVNDDGFEDAEFYVSNNGYKSDWGLKCNLPIIKAIEMFGDKFTNYNRGDFIRIDYGGVGLTSETDCDFSDDEQFNENVTSQLEDMMYEYCCTLESNIEDDYDYRHTDEWKTESYLAHETEFLADGTRYIYKG